MSVRTGGRQATVELLQFTRIRADQGVLDIGAGLGGPARPLASAYDCQVACLERSGDYCAEAKLLNRLIGLEDHVEIHQVSALHVPFLESSF